MTDIEKAKEILFSGNYSCVLCRGNSVFKSAESGIKPIVMLCGDGKCYKDFSAADKIVGKAAAMLYVKLGVREVYAQVLSRGGEQILKKYSVKYSYSTLCDEIINRKGTDVCPMEKAVRNVEKLDEAYNVLLEKITE